MTRSIAQAAAETSYFERTRIHHSAAEIRLSETMAQLPGVSFEAVGVTTTVRSYTIKDVVLDADTGLLFQEQHVIPANILWSADDPHAIHRIHTDPLPDAILYCRPTAADQTGWRDP